MAVIRIFAAGAPIAFEAESGALAGGATIASVTGQSGTGAVKFAAAATPTPTPTPTGTLMGWQKTAGNTGLASVGLSCDSLPTYTGPEFVPAGTTITGKRFTGGVVLSAGNITIDKSCFKPTGVGQGLPVVSTTNNNICNNDGCQPAQGPVTISNSEYDGTLLSTQEAALSACAHGSMNQINNYCHHFGSGFAIINAGSTYSVTIDSNYIDDMVAWGDGATTGNHSDGFTIRDFNIDTTPTRQAIIRNNRINTASANTTGSFFIQDTWSAGISNVYTSGNLFTGLGWEMSAEKRNAPVTNINITNNRFGGTTDGGYGACATPNFGWTFTQNYINDPTKADNKGAAVSC